MEQNRAATKTDRSRLNHNRRKFRRSPTTVISHLHLGRLSHLVAGVWALVAALATASNWTISQIGEAQTSSLFFALRGPVAPPDNIVILAIDQLSLSVPAQYYRTDPQRYAYMEPLQAWPWKRSVYAQVIERLMTAGARSIALDILFTSPSSYGREDDQQLAEVLQRYAGRVTLAAEYQEFDLHQGRMMQLLQPEQLFWTQPMSIGFVNFPLESDGRIYRFASEFAKIVAPKYQRQLADFDPLNLAMPSFEESTVVAAQLDPKNRRGDYIYFYGPSGTFDRIPILHILEPSNWQTYLQNGKFFQDKIVIIGSTATSLPDFHSTPFSQNWLYPEPMPGVEVQANAIASLITGQTLAQAIPQPQLRGLFVLLLVAGTVILVTKSKRRALTRFTWVIGIATAWVGISYYSFVYQQLILPTAAPIVALGLSGCSYLAIAALNHSWQQRDLRRTLRRYASFPIVREIINQQVDLHDLLYQSELGRIGDLIGGRYRIVKVLGSGGFGETYIAEDSQRPGNPHCVVKQLRPANNHPKHLQLARRLFQLEAETLEKLGTHNQIPQLFAYFEENEEFYLVQELIVGRPLSQELYAGKLVSEAAVVQILQDILGILAFVHTHQVIHRDIKPSNIIRRQSDGKLVLIDFGAVKQVSTQLLDTEPQASLTIGIGTYGYAPSEQCAGRALFSSDIYAVGMVGIKALTGLAPHELQLDAKTGKCLWQHKAEVSSELAAILSKMVHYDFTRRYQSVAAVQTALRAIAKSISSSLVVEELSTDILFTETDTPTETWQEQTEGRRLKTEG